MQRLANFSIETDTVVLLQFQGGSTRRVAVDELGQYLPSADLRQVRAALKLRQDFLLRHMPRIGAVAVLLGGVSAALLMGGGQAVANLFHPAPAPTTAPVGQPEVRMTLPQPAVQHPATPAPVREAPVRPVAPPAPVLSAATLPNGKPRPTPVVAVTVDLPLPKPVTGLVGSLLGAQEPTTSNLKDTVNE